MRAGMLCVGMLLVVPFWSGDVVAAPSDIPTAPTAASLADPSRWRFVGCVAFQADELRDALAANVDVIVASRSSATIDKLIEVVTRELKLGYESVGHPDAVVSADVDRNAGQLVITIEEGTLYTQGKVEVRGAVLLDTKRLIAAIIQKYAPAEAIPVFSESPSESDAPLRWLKPNGEPEKLNDAIWVVGDSASFADSSWKAAEPVIQLMMKREGFADPVISVTVERAEENTATMVVNILDEGPRVVLGDIEIVGNERNTSAEILEYLQLSSGQPFNALRQARTNWLLRESARFLKHDVQLSPPPIGDGPSRLKLTLVEAPHVSTLKEPFTPEQQVAIRAAHWMSTQRDFDWEISLFSDRIQDNAGPFWEQFSGSKMSLRYILSPVDRGMLLEVLMTDRDDKRSWGQVLSVGQAAGWLLAPQRQSKMEWGPLHGTLVLNISVGTNPPTEIGQMTHMNFGCGVNSAEAKDGRPIRDVVSIAPLAMILMLTKDSPQVELNGDRMTIRGVDFELVIDAETGRFMKWQFQHGDAQISIRTDKNILTTAANQWQLARDASRNQLEPTSPVTTVLNYLVAEARFVEKLQSQPLPHWFRLVERLLYSGVLRSLDEAVTKSSDNGAKSDRFSIPVKLNPHSPLGPMAWLDPFIRGALPMYARAFPHETPGWTIGRELSLLLLQPKGVEIPSPIGVSLMLDADKAGPLHYLLAAQLFGIVSPAHRFILANVGLEALSANAFRNDVIALLHERGFGSHSANAVLELLRNLDESDLDDLAESLSLTDEDKSLVSSLLKELTRRRDEPANVLLPELAERTWPLFRPQIDTALRELAIPPTPLPQPAVRVTAQPAQTSSQSESPLSKPLPPLPPVPSSFKTIPDEPLVPTISPKKNAEKPFGGDSP